MKPDPKAPAETPEPSAFEKMKDLTRRVIRVPREEALKPQKKRKPHQ